MNATRSSLEPVGRFALATVVVHGLVFGALGLWIVNEVQSFRGSRQPALRWISPGDITMSAQVPAALEKTLDLPVVSAVSRVPATEMPPADPPPVATRAPRIDIVVVKPPPPKPPLPPRSTLPVFPVETFSKPRGEVTGVDMSSVDAAIVARFRENWLLPDQIDLSIRRTVEMDVSIFRDGTVGGFLLVKPSGVSQIDVSALHAAEKIKTIGVPLPVEFSGDRYEVRMHFHAE